MDYFTRDTHTMYYLSPVFPKLFHFPMFYLFIGNVHTHTHKLYRKWIHEICVDYV